MNGRGNPISFSEKEMKQIHKGIQKMIKDLIK